MDLLKALRELNQERHRLDLLIANLDALKRGNKPTKPARRGRKTMPPEERKVVSERMRAYWAKRKGASPGARGTAA
jgi:hypothetical protein